MKFTKLLALALALVMILSFAACGDNSDKDAETSDLPEDTGAAFDPDAPIDLTGPFSVTFELELDTLEYTYYDYEVVTQSVDLSISYLDPKQFSVEMTAGEIEVALVCVNDILYMDANGEKAGINVSDESFEALRDKLKEMIPSDVADEFEPIVDAVYDFVVSLLDGVTSGTEMMELYEALAPFMEDMNQLPAEVEDAQKAVEDAVAALAEKLANGEEIADADLDACAEALADYLEVSGLRVSAETVRMALDLIIEAAASETQDIEALADSVTRVVAAFAGDITGEDIPEEMINEVATAVATFTTDFIELFDGVELADLIGINESADSKGNHVVEITGLTDLAFDKISATIDLINALAASLGEDVVISESDKADVLESLELVSADKLSVKFIMGETTLGFDGSFVTDTGDQEFTLTESIMITWSFEDITIEAPADAGAYSIVSLADLMDAMGGSSDVEEPVEKDYIY